MSIQATVFLTREEAEEKLREKRSRQSEICQLSDEQIESELDEQFYNYQITGGER